MIRVVIESPLAAPTPAQIEEHKTYARRCMVDSLVRGEAPYASHLLFDQPGILDDTDPDQRAMGMEAGFTWGEVAQLVAIYTDYGISPGMVRGIDIATQRGIAVTRRSIGRNP